MKVGEFWLVPRHDGNRRAQVCEVVGWGVGDDGSGGVMTIALLKNRFGEQSEVSADWLEEFGTLQEQKK